MMKPSLLILMACLALPPQARAAQAQSQGRVVVETAIIWRTDSPIVVGSARMGMVLDLTARSDRWYEVVVPPSLGGRGERGLIARSQVQLLPGSTEPPERALRGSAPVPPPRGGPGPAQRPVTRRTRPRPMLPGFVSVNGTYQTRTTGFQDTQAFRVNVEDSQFTTAYTLESGPAFDVGAGGLVTNHFAIGGAFTRFSQSSPGVLTAAVPHPFFFNRPRMVSGSVDELDREELAGHLQARFVWPFTPRFRASAFGGPSIFRVTQGIVTNFSYGESYPYDTATFEGATTTESKKTGIGYNVGGDATFFVTRRIGAGFSVTFARATLKVPTTGSRTVEVDAGGLQAGGGLRLRF
jgi:hypothetical protein